MSYVPTSVVTTAAITAAAAKAARDRQEEEDMTGYSKADLDGWEFKIMRSNMGKFKDYQKVQILCQEEAKAGWEMVEKFDNYRIRFKRRIDKRAGDRSLQTDPYRTNVGVGSGKMVLTISAVVFLLIGVLFFLIIYLKS
ncbi:MAG: hypothetical protein GY839_14035 [candidate division Zixibacteria bacterium]|nr:hypothetical protein [candidate division Zixibacteria bacterium]